MPLGRTEARWGVILSFIFLLAVAATAHAHFLLNLNVRILHVEHLADGLRVYLRTPMPYLVADRVGPVGSNGLPEPAPYTTNRIEDEKLVHYLDPDQLRRHPEGLGSFAGEGFRLVAEGKPLDATVEQVHVYRVGTQPDFATLDEARTAFAAGHAGPEAAKPLYVGDAVVDIVLRYRVGAPIHSYSVSSTLDPGLPGQENTANLILDYGPEGTKVFRARGLLAEPIIISRSAISAIVTFIKEGFRHILDGLDHVLFVLCLVLGATALRSLIVLPRSEQNSSERNLFFVTCAIGLLHGLGFSFVLHKILQITSPDIWQSLLAFNVGIEMGQLTIIVIAWPAFRLIQRSSEYVWRIGRVGIATVCIAVAAVWTGQRVLSVIGTL
jgi:hypothetical protein